VCTEDAPSCVRREVVFLSPVVGLFQGSDVLASPLPLVFGNTFYVNELTEDQMKE